MKDWRRKLYLPGLGSSIGMPNIFFQNGPEHGFFDRFCPPRNVGTSDSARATPGIVLIKNVEKVKRRVARRSKVPKDHPCRVGWCNCTNYARTTVLFIRLGFMKKGAALSSTSSLEFRDEESNRTRLTLKSLRISIYERPQTRIDAPLCELPGSFPLHPVPLFPLG